MSIQAHYALAQLEAYQGNMDKAVARMGGGVSDCLVGRPGGCAAIDRSARRRVFPQVGDGERRLSQARREMSFSAAARRPYQKTADSEKAIEYFLKYLAQKPERTAPGEMAAEPGLHDARKISVRRARGVSDPSLGI